MMSSFISGYVGQSALDSSPKASAVRAYEVPLPKFTGTPSITSLSFYDVVIAVPVSSSESIVYAQAVEIQSYMINSQLANITLNNTSLNLSNFTSTASANYASLSLTS